jgi:hypothetical protein
MLIITIELCQTTYFAIYIPILLTKFRCIKKFGERSKPENKDVIQRYVLQLVHIVKIHGVSRTNHVHDVTTVHVISLAATGKPHGKIHSPTNSL